MISTYRVNPEISAPVIIWGIASAAIRTQRAAVRLAKLSDKRLLSLYVSLIVAAIVAVKLAQMVPGAVVAVAENKMFRFALVAAAVVAGIVGLAMLAAAQPMLLVGGALIAVYGVMTWGWK